MTDQTPVARPFPPTPLTEDMEPPAGAPPDLIWAPLADLVLPDYQRGTKERAAQTLIRRIAQTWDWRRCGAIVVARVDTPEGPRWAVTDGQHRAIAAMMRGDIDALPAVVNRDAAPEEGAKAFVGLNRDRRALSAQATFWAEMAAGDEAAAAIAGAAADADVAILRNPRPAQDCGPGETMAIGELRKIYARKGRAGLRRALGIARRADLAPILGNHLKALAGALWEPELQGAHDDRLARALADKWDHIEDAADELVLDSGQSRPRCLAIELAKAARGL